LWRCHRRRPWTALGKNALSRTPTATTAMIRHDHTGPACLPALSRRCRRRTPAQARKPHHCLPNSPCFEGAAVRVVIGAVSEPCIFRWCSSEVGCAHRGSAAGSADWVGYEAGPPRSRLPQRGLGGWAARTIRKVRIIHAVRRPGSEGQSSATVRAGRGATSTGPVSPASSGRAAPVPAMPQGISG
jgi:hypothetical protein